MVYSTVEHEKTDLGVADDGLPRVLTEKLHALLPLIDVVGVLPQKDRAHQHRTPFKEMFKAGQSELNVTVFVEVRAESVRVFFRIALLRNKNYESKHKKHNNQRRREMRGQLDPTARNITNGNNQNRHHTSGARRNRKIVVNRGDKTAANGVDI